MATIDLSNIADFVANEGHGVKGLSEIGLQKLPKQYIQPIEERITTNTVILDDQIPIIDMSNWDSHNKLVSQKISNAYEKWVYFKTVEKYKHSKENSSTNNVRYGTSFSPKAEKVLEWKDYLSLFYVSDEEAAAHWPCALRDEALEFLRNSEIVMKKLLEALMKGLNVKEIDESVLMGSKRINFNYYPKCPNPELTVGIGRHSDVSTLTILLQDNIGGLYVKKLDSDMWVHVPPIHGALVINIGDALQIISNGRYKSIEHRVMANGNNNRISVPIFVNPKPSDIIGPLKELLESGEEPIYKQVLYSDYVKHFFKKAHDGKDTVDFAKIN
ncbi:hypothetical protein R3W88_030563 [Solanum pinnatisectum]|uniref:Fe2OG dioxygenase domain-containing protein n=1 Tax=Solanum pinnatisectum TaxID=50273 RepID=A0AAV9LIV9_9SOLN|nr:hypothetical protein R3W88_030563 [Solanum pinnatisectum]